MLNCWFRWGKGEREGGKWWGDIYIYMYIYRDRERERERKGNESKRVTRILLGVREGGGVKMEGNVCELPSKRGQQVVGA